MSRLVVIVSLQLRGTTEHTEYTESNWVPAPEGTFSLYIRVYWDEQSVLEGTRMPPQVLMVK